MVLNSKIEVRDSKIAGRGLYAKERITKGEMVCCAASVGVSD
jgi:SET domain-containing protein